MPGALQTAAGFSWRTLTVIGLVVVAALAFWLLRALTMPVVVAALMSTQLLPMTLWLTGRGVPRALSVVVVMLALVAAIAFITIVIVGSLVSQLDQVGLLVSQAADQVTSWLAHHQGPLQLSGGKVSDLGKQAGPALANAANALFDGVLGGASLFAQLIGGIALALAFLIYILSDGEHVGTWLVERGAPEDRERRARMGAAGWATLGAYVRGVTIVALFDAVFIGLGLVLLNVPIAGSLTVMVFLAAFVPIAGAWVSGIVCVAVALAGNGFTAALLVLAIVLAVQEVESVVLDPLVYQRQVHLHPIATLAAVTAGGVLAGVIGALISVPVVAVVWAIVRENDLHAQEGSQDAANAVDPGPDPVTSAG